MWLPHTRLGTTRVGHNKGPTIFKQQPQTFSIHGTTHPYRSIITFCHCQNVAAGDLVSLTKSASAVVCVGVRRRPPLEVHFVVFLRVRVGLNVIPSSATRGDYESGTRIKKERVSRPGQMDRFGQEIKQICSVTSIPRNMDFPPPFFSSSSVLTHAPPACHVNSRAKPLAQARNVEPNHDSGPVPSYTQRYVSEHTIHRN